MKTCTFFGQSINGNQEKYISEIIRILDREIGDETADILFADIGRCFLIINIFAQNLRLQKTNCTVSLDLLTVRYERSIHIFEPIDRVLQDYLCRKAVDNVLAFASAGVGLVEISRGGNRGKPFVGHCNGYSRE